MSDPQILERLDVLTEGIATLTTEVRGIHQRIDETNQRIDETNQRIDETNQRIETEVKRWDERFFQFTRDQLTTSRTIIVAAAATVIFGSVISSFDQITVGIARVLGN